MVILNIRITLTFNFHLIRQGTILDIIVILDRRYEQVPLHKAEPSPSYSCHLDF